MVRALIGCSVQIVALALALHRSIFANSSVHSESCLACDLTMSLRSMKLSGVPNSPTSAEKYPRLHHLCSELKNLCVVWRIRVHPLSEIEPVRGVSIPKP
jgi:hypothetical protein